MEKSDIHDSKHRSFSKKIILLIIIVLLCVSGMFVISQLQQKPIISSTLSERSKEYLQEKNSEEHSSLKNVAVDDGTQKKPADSSVTVGDCFTITVPFTIRSIEQKKPCYAYVVTDNPRGRITIYQEDGHIGEPDQIPGLSMRRLKTDLYSEVDKIYNGRTYYIFKRLDEAYEKTVFSSSTANYIILTLTAAASEEDADKKLYQMLASINYLK